MNLLIALCIFMAPCLKEFKNALNNNKVLELSCKSFAPSYRHRNYSKVNKPNKPPTVPKVFLQACSLTSSTMMMQQQALQEIRSTTIPPLILSITLKKWQTPANPQVKVGTASFLYNTE